VVKIAEQAVFCMLIWSAYIPTFGGIVCQCCLRCMRNCTGQQHDCPYLWGMLPCLIHHEAAGL
jgi:hypothetical protein